MDGNYLINVCRCFKSQRSADDLLIVSLEREIKRRKKVKKRVQNDITN